MTARAIRRAAERHAAKLAARAAKATAASVGSTGDEINIPVVEISEAKLAANRENARLSTGPKTEAGREASSRNAVTHGLTSQSALLPGDDAAAYETLVKSHFARHSPVTDEERELVQLIADSKWRLLKIAPLEAGIYEVGRLEQDAVLYVDEKDPVRRAGLINAAVSMLCGKHLKNLHLQERRIRNQHASDIAKLQALQKDRMEKAQHEAEQAREANIKLIQSADAIEQECRTRKIPFIPTDFGFDFEADEWNRFKTLQNTFFAATKDYLDLNKAIAAYRTAQETEKVA